MKKTQSISAAILVALLFGLCATNAPAVSTTLSGATTTTTGQLLPKGSTVIVLDATGVMRPVTTTKAGFYSISTSGLTPPLLVEGGTLFSYSEGGTGSANINQLTDLIVNMSFQAMGTSPTAQIDVAASPRQRASSAITTVSPAIIQLATALLDRAVQRAYQIAKVRARANFNPITSNISSSLEDTFRSLKVVGNDTATESLMLDLGPSTFTSSFDVNQTAGTITASVLDGSGTATTQTNLETIVSNGTGFAPAYEAALKAVSTFQGTINEYGANLTDDQLFATGVIASNFLSDGLPASDYFGILATIDLRLNKDISFDGCLTESYRPGSETAITLDCLETNKALPWGREVTFDLGCGPTACLFVGNGQGTAFSVTPVRLFQPGSTNSSAFLDVSATNPEGTVTDITFVVPALGIASTSLNLIGTGSLEYWLDPKNSPESYSYNQWYFQTGDYPSTELLGNTVNGVVTYKNGSTETVNKMINEVTNETVVVTKSPLPEASPGLSVKLKWEALKTATPVSTSASLTACSDAGTVIIQPQKTLTAGATSATFAIPANVAGKPPTNYGYIVIEKTQNGAATATTDATGPTCLPSSASSFFTLP